MKARRQKASPVLSFTGSGVGQGGEVAELDLHSLGACGDGVGRAVGVGAVPVVQHQGIPHPDPAAAGVLGVKTVSSGRKCFCPVARSENWPRDSGLATGGEESQLRKEKDSGNFPESG